MKGKLITIIVSVLVWVIMAPGCAQKVQPPKTPADFYKGKTIELVATGSPGGDEDLITRLIASYLSGDTDSSVVVTLRKGAGGLDGINYVYRSKADGLTMGTVPSAGFILNKVMDEPAAVYDIGKFSYIMSIGRELRYFCVSPDSPYQSIADLQTAKDLRFGAGSPSGSISLGGLTVIKILGLDAKVITGFSGDSNRALAVKRGEIAGYTSDIVGVEASMQAGLVKPLFVLAAERDQTMSEVPAITELVNLNDDDLALIRLWETALASSLTFTASPGIPEERLLFIRNLAEKWTEDEGFREGINRISGYEVKRYITGDEVTKAMLDMAAALTKFQATFAELIEKYRA